MKAHALRRSQRRPSPRPRPPSDVASDRRSVLFKLCRPEKPLMSTYAPCPNCQNSYANPVSFTWWGGMLGPKLLTHVKCASCGTAYNGKSGASNAANIAIYSVIMLVVAGAIGFAFV